MPKSLESAASTSDTPGATKMRPMIATKFSALSRLTQDAMPYTDHSGTSTEVIKAAGFNGIIHKKRSYVPSIAIAN